MAELCKNGHERTIENTYRGRCVLCRREAVSRAYHRQQAERRRRQMKET